MSSKPAPRFRQSFFALFIASIAIIMVLVRIAVLRQTLLGHDQSWYLFAAQRVLGGVQLYGPGLSDTNPPLIIWFSTIPILLARLLHLSPTAAFRTLIILMICASVAWCIRLLRRSPLTASTPICSLLALGILYVQFMIFQEDFGQREHLFVILGLPYLLAVALGVVRDLSLAERCALGFTAGLAICLKPQEAFVFIAFELVLLVWKRTLRRLISPELLTLVLTGCIYLILVRIFTPLYTKQVVPLLIDTYWAYATSTALTLTLVEKKKTLIALALILTALYFRRSLTLALPLAAFAASALGAVIAFDIQHVAWVYHVYPISAFAILALLFLLTDILRNVIPRLAAGPRIAAPVMLLTLVVIGIATHTLLKGLRPPIIANESGLGRFLTQYNSPETIYVFSTSLGPFSEVFHQGLNWGSRFPCLWNLPAIIQNERGANVPPSLFKHLPPDTLVQRSSAQRLQVAEDLNLYRPPTVLVEQCTRLQPCQALDGKDFDLIPWFRQSPEFATAWSHYQLQPGAPSGFDLYKRVF
jgi:hypothetical protein